MVKKLSELELALKKIATLVQDRLSTKQDALIFNTVYDASTNKVATMSDIPLLTNYILKNNTAGLLKNDGTVDTNTYLTSAPVTSVNGSTGAVVISNATTSAAGLMSSTDKQKVDSVLSLTTVSGTTATQTLSPNVVYSFGEMTSLTVTFESPVSGVNNQYVFEFDSGSTATNLSVPNDVIWPATLTIKANKHYEINIKYNASTLVYYGLILEFDLPLSS